MKRSRWSPLSVAGDGRPNRRVGRPNGAGGNEDSVAAAGAPARCVDRGRFFDGGILERVLFEGWLGGGFRPRGDDGRESIADPVEAVAAGRGQEAVVADLGEFVGRSVMHETSDELTCGEDHR